MSAPQSKPVTKARAFEPSELVEAFGKIDVKNCYELVRGALGVTAHFGANRIAEIKEMTMSGNDFSFVNVSFVLMFQRLKAQSQLAARRKVCFHKYT